MIPFKYVWRLVDSCYADMELSSLGNDFAFQNETRSVLNDTLHQCGWTQEKFDIELLSHINRSWGSSGSGGNIFPLKTRYSFINRKAA